MAKVNGKQKGNSFERNIANCFSEHFQDITLLESAFRRNPDSGSFFGGTNESRNHTHDTDFAIYGDLICPKNFKFCVECKWYKTPPSIKNIMSQSVKNWNDWIEQVEQDSKNSDKHPLLIVKYNRTGTIFFINQEDCDKDILNYILDNYLFSIKYKKYLGMSMEQFFTIPKEHYFI